MRAAMLKTSRMENQPSRLPSFLTTGRAEFPMRLVFMGTPEFAVPVLSDLIGAGHSVVCVYSQPPRPAGRGQKARLSPVHAYAEAHGIPVRTPDRLSALSDQELFRDLQADAAIVVAYGLILPRPILEAPRLGCINVHASLLPRWRGAAPIQRAIEAGDTMTGVTIMMMGEGLDTGPMLLSQAVPIGPTTTAGELHDRMAPLGGPLVVQALDGLSAGTLAPEAQPNEGVTYAQKIDKTEAAIDWRLPAETLDRKIRALTPWPGAYFEIAGREGRPERVKILVAQAVEGSGVPGHAMDDRGTIACGEGALRLIEVQRAGKAPMKIGAFLNGFPLPAGRPLVPSDPVSA